MTHNKLEKSIFTTVLYDIYFPSPTFTQEFPRRLLMFHPIKAIDQKLRPGVNFGGDGFGLDLELHCVDLDLRLRLGLCWR